MNIFQNVITLMVKKKTIYFSTNIQSIFKINVHYIDVN